MFGHLLVMTVYVIAEIKITFAVNPGSEVSNKNGDRLFQCYIFFFTAVHCCCNFFLAPGRVILQDIFCQFFRLGQTNATMAERPFVFIKQAF